MTLRLIDGFDYNPVNSDFWDAMGWGGAAAGLYVDPNTAFGYGNYGALSNGGSNNVTAYRNLRGRYTDDQVCTIGFRCFVPQGNQANFGVYDSMSTLSDRQWYIRFTSTGNISFYNFPFSNEVLSARSAAWSFFPDTWFYLEIQFKPGYGTSGTFEVRVNTVVVLSLPATATAAGTPISPATGPGFDTLMVHSGGAGRYYMDDMYFLDDNGGELTSYLGNTRVKLLAPVSNASPIDWTIGGSSPAANNWQSVLNIALNDTKFNYTSTPGDRDLYNINPIVNAPFVYGIEVDGSYRQDDATQRVVRNSIESGGVSAYGEDFYTNAFYTIKPDVWELNPDTGVSFTGAEVNALKIGPELVT